MTDLEIIIREIPGYDPYATAGDAWFDNASARLAVEFFPECLRHVEGEVAGRPFVLERWEKAIVGNIFGWKRKDDRGRIVRRYREAFIYVPRKNGKSPIASGIGLFVFFCDDENGQQDYIAATTRDQAGIMFRHCKGMIEREPQLSKRCRIYGGTSAAGQARSIVRESDGSFLRVIAGEAGGQHGQNPHLILIDELHAQPNRELIDTLRTGTASLNRAQPLIVYITTADYERESICNELYRYACKVRDGTFTDPAFLPCIWEAKIEDDWTSPAVWRKANPNLGVSVSEEYLAREVVGVGEEPARLNEFLRLHLNVVTKQRTRWLDDKAWSECREAFDPAELEGRPCYGGLDLSAKYDLTAFVLVFPWDDGVYRVLPRFWIPEKAAAVMERKKSVPYSAWKRSEALRYTPGESVDYGLIEAQILEDCATYQVRAVAFDPWNANATRTRLEDQGVNMVEFPQNLRQFNEPTKEFGRLIKDRKLRHDGNPVLTWCAENVEVYTDASGNIRPVKPKDDSPSKIDGIVAAVMALGTAQRLEDSVYGSQGMLYLGDEAGEPTEDTTEAIEFSDEWSGWN